MAAVIYDFPQLELEEFSKTPFTLVPLKLDKMEMLDTFFSKRGKGVVFSCRYIKKEKSKVVQFMFKDISTSDSGANNYNLLRYKPQGFFAFVVKRRDEYVDDRLSLALSFQLNQWKNNLVRAERRKSGISQYTSSTTISLADVVGDKALIN